MTWQPPGWHSAAFSSTSRVGTRGEACVPDTCSLLSQSQAMCYHTKRNPCTKPTLQAMLGLQQTRTALQQGACDNSQSAYCEFRNNQLHSRKEPLSV
eukprot:4214381-Amphidinium_carterae.1